MDKVDENDLLKSIHPKNNRKSLFKANVAIKEGLSTNNGGASGSFFFFTQDKNYIIKTISKEEL